MISWTRWSTTSGRRQVTGYALLVNRLVWVAGLLVNVWLLSGSHPRARRSAKPDKVHLGTSCHLDP